MTTSVAAQPNTSSPLTVRRISGALGAELRGLRVADLDDAGFDALRAALIEHKVIFLPEQHVTPDEHRAFGSRFGEMELHPYLPKLDEEHPEIVVLRSGNGFIADVWHTDVTFVDSPPKFSVLNMLEPSPYGGDTMWTNQALAYASLSAPMREMLLGLTAVHTARKFGDPSQQAEHPVVRRHPETGEPSLFVNRQFTERITALSRGESDALLSYLYSFSEQPHFTCRYSWSPGAIGIWDNRITQHYVVNDFEGDRTISRVTITGDDPQPAGDTSRWNPYAVRRMSAAGHEG
ncbi:MAG TPA: TauD/TfdA family dioxygenase [Frankiaceae bacterium]|jgi:taurine dioxygenase|nr:TauD/TfdA family dioxygenase [Frankiaceae bacterium]